MYLYFSPSTLGAISILPVKSDNFFAVISSEAENSGVEGINLNRAEAGVYRFESKTPGELTLIHTLSGEEQTVTVPTNVGQGTRINFSELGVQVELNNQYDGSVVIGQETVDQAQTVYDTALTALTQAEVALARLSNAQAAHDEAHVALGEVHDEQLSTMASMTPRLHSLKPRLYS